MGIPNILYLGEVIEESYKKSSCFNTYFQSIFASSVRTHSYPPLNEQIVNQMPPVVLSVEGIKKCLDELDIKKVVGPDGLSPRVLKLCSFVVSRYLEIIFL